MKYWIRNIVIIIIVMIVKINLLCNIVDVDVDCCNLLCELMFFFFLSNIW